MADPQETDVRRPLNRLNDFLFKRIFGSEDHLDILVAFLNAVLEPAPDERIMSVELLDREMDPQFLADKSSRLDLLARDVQGHLFNVEVQVLNTYEMRQRSLYYWATLYQSQLKEGQPYRELKPATAINVLGFEFAPGEQKYHHVFELRERSTASLLCGDLRIDFLEVPKARRAQQTVDSPLQRWLAFLGGANDETLEPLIKEEPMIKKALTLEEMFLQDDRAHWAYVRRQLDIRNIQSGLDGALHEGMKRGMEEGMEKGMEEGMEKGMEKGMEEMLRRNVSAMRARGMDTAAIASLLDISEEEVARLG